MKNYYSSVKKILEDHEEARDDDMLLYGLFLAKFNIVGFNETFYEVMRSAKKRKLPSYESITRSRRKIQEKEPALQGKRRQARKEEETRYHDYYSFN